MNQPTARPAQSGAAPFSWDNPYPTARTRYEVDRTPRNSSGRDAAAYEPPQRTNAAAQAAPVSM